MSAVSDGCIVAPRVGASRLFVEEKDPAPIRSPPPAARRPPFGWSARAGA